MNIYLKNKRRDLHLIPELAYNEVKTHSYIFNELRDLGFEPTTFNRTGIILYINNNKESTIAFRTGIDGELIKENTKLEFKSINNNMHTRGNDGTISILLGLAKYIKSSKIKYKNNILLIFQPSQLNGDGAKRLLDKITYDISEIYNIKMNPCFNSGLLICSPLTSCLSIDIKIKSENKNNKDKTSIDSICNNHYLKNIILKELKNNKLLFSLNEKLSLPNIFSTQTSKRYNITISSYLKDDLNTLIQNIIIFKNYIKIEYNADVDLTIKIKSNLVDINKSLINKHFTLFSESNEHLNIIDDFSFYLKKYSGLNINLGTHNKIYSQTEFNSKFNFDDNILEKGLNCFIKILEKQ